MTRSEDQAAAAAGPVLSPLLNALPLPHAHLAALAVDRLAARWHLPGAAAVLLLL